eukprot:TRINITY_DN6796_c0_g2_i1.p1 TRINITY_DN6796_c0_g2~~TRINITY_DN6796_c0_g2_i1.p1  ORF type:complete len:533 (+),score=142.57 TRINITY_DN6796_c0_g2_i1:85-1683(+)
MGTASSGIMSCCATTAQPTSRIVPTDDVMEDIWLVYEKIRQLGKAAAANSPTKKPQSYYEARHKRTGEIHALKLMAKTDENRPRFEREVDILSSVNHPGIVALKGAFEDQHNFIIVYEFLKGEELFERTRTLKNFSEKAASVMVQNMLRAVCNLHEKNICHLNLNPENFIFAELGNDDSIKLSNFAFAMRVDEEKDDYPACGSLIYKSPEMSDPRFQRTPDVLKKADAYSFGVTLYTMLIGRFPAFNSKGDLLFPPDLDPSQEVQELLKGLTHGNWKHRLSLTEALSHPWVTGVAAPSIPFKKTLFNGLRSYRFMNPFQKAVIDCLSKRLSDDDKRALSASFSALDVNGDGKLDLFEVTSFLKGNRSQLDLESDKAAAKRAKLVHTQLDQDKDGFVDSEEFLEVQVLGSLVGEDSEFRVGLRCLFKTMDTKGDQDVSVDEFAAFLGDSYDPRTVKKLFALADRDSDGLLSFDDFVEAMSAGCGGDVPSKKSAVEELKKPEPEHKKTDTEQKKQNKLQNLKAFKKRSTSRGER